MQRLWTRAAWPERAELWAEFLFLFLVIPVAIAVFLPPRMMFPALFLFTALGLILLSRQPGFRWGQLIRGLRPMPWGVVAGFTLATIAASLAVIGLTAPEAAFAIVKARPLLLLMIWALYPFLSALPQELIFRALFFRRYGALLPDPRAAIVLNGAIFSLAHLMYWSWIVALMTFAGGIVFGWAYEIRRSFPLALLLHAIAGWIIFTVGLGLFFYSGNVQRPF